MTDNALLLQNIQEGVAVLTLNAPSSRFSSTQWMSSRTPRCIGPPAPLLHHTPQNPNSDVVVRDP